MQILNSQSSSETHKCNHFTKYVFNTFMYHIYIYVTGSAKRARNAFYYILQCAACDNGACKEFSGGGGGGGGGGLTRYELFYGNHALCES